MPRQTAAQDTRTHLPRLAAAGAIVGGLYVVSRYNYLLFHSLVELFSVLIAFAVFSFAWHTRRLLNNHYLLFLGIASLFTGALDLMHLLTYAGMGVFPGRGANLPTQFWIAFRFVFSLSFLLASFFAARRVRIGALLLLYTAGTGLLIAAVFLGWFPVCYDAGVGLTPFKIAAEYVICLIFLAALIRLVQSRQAFDPGVLRLLVGSLLFSIASEISFTQYVSVFGFSNMLGHLFLLASVAFLYRAVVATGVEEPSRVLFRDLQKSTAALQASEGKYRLLFENMLNAFAFHRIVLDAQGKPVDYIFLEVNDAFERMTGLRREDIIGKGVREALPGIENDPADWIGVYGDVALTGRAVRFERPAAVLGRWYSVYAYSPLREHFVAIFEDVTERKQNEEALRRANSDLEQRIRDRAVELAHTNDTLRNEIAVRREAVEDLDRLNRLYGMLSKINEAIVRHTDSQSLYEQVCRVTVEDGLFKMAWIGLLDVFTQEVRPQASFGDANGYLQDIRITSSDAPDGRGPTGRAVFEGQTVLCTDIANDPCMQPWRDKALQQGFRSSAAFPLQSGGAVVGALTVYAAEPRTFTERETSLFSSLVDDLSFALDTLADRRRRHLAEAALHKASAYNRSLIEASLDPLVTIDAEGRITDANAAAETATGRLRTELIGTDFSGYFTDPERARDGYRQAFREGSVRDYALEIRSRDGKATPVLYNASVYRDEAGQVLGVFAAARDITGRRESERRLTLTNDLLKLYTRKFSRREYLDVAVELIRGWSGCRYTGIRIADADGKIPYESCVGYSSDFLDSESELSLIADECICPRIIRGAAEHSDRVDMTPQGSFFSNDTHAFLAGLSAEERTRYRGVCMQYGYRSLAVVPVRHDDRILGAIHIADEQTDRVPLARVEFVEQLAVIVGEALFRFGIEDEVRQLNRELEQRVRERTAQLEAANHELEAFAYSVSHDLRTPLRSIDGFSSALLEDYADRLDETGRDYFERIRGATARMGELIDALLSLSRLTRRDLTRVPVDLSRIAGEIADELKAAEPGRAAEFRIEREVVATGDPAMLRAAMENLLANAWKFTGTRAAAVIAFGTVRQENGRTIFFVRDNGVGFDMAYGKKLFTAFSRLHAASEFQGIGIGLATVQRIVHRHGGAIWAEGAVDKGATIYFTL